MVRTLVVAAVLAILAVSVSGVPTDHKRGPKDLSDQTHFVGDKRDHNADYDHEAFLGEDEAKTFDQLSPGEAKRRLGIIVDKIDKNRDGKVTEEELIEWVRHVARRQVHNTGVSVVLWARTLFSFLVGVFSPPTRKRR